MAERKQETAAMVRIDPAESEAIEIRFLHNPPEVVVLRHGMAYPEGGEAVYSEMIDDGSDRRQCAQQPCNREATEEVITNYGPLGWLCPHHFNMLKISLGSPTEQETWEDLYAPEKVRTGIRCPSEHPTIIAARCCMHAGHLNSSTIKGFEERIYHRYTSGADGRSVSWHTDPDLSNPVAFG